MLVNLYADFVCFVFERLIFLIFSTFPSVSGVPGQMSLCVCCRLKRKRGRMRFIDLLSKHCAQTNDSHKATCDDRVSHDPRGVFHFGKSDNMFCLADSGVFLLSPLMKTRLTGRVFSKMQMSAF